MREAKTPHTNKHTHAQFGRPQANNLKNVERLLRQQGVPEAAELLNDLNVFPHFLWGGARFEVARLWASEQIIAVEPEGPQDSAEAEAAGGGGGGGGGEPAAAGGGIAALESNERDDDWTDDGSGVGELEAEGAEEPEQEEATSETINFVDTVRDAHTNRTQGGV